MRRRGHAAESGEIAPGFASVASPVLDHNAHPVAAVAVTFEESTTEGSAGDMQRTVVAVVAAAEELTGRISSG